MRQTMREQNSRIAPQPKDPITPELVLVDPALRARALPTAAPRERTAPRSSQGSVSGVEQAQKRLLQTPQRQLPLFGRPFLAYAAAVVVLASVAFTTWRDAADQRKATAGADAVRSAVDRQRPPPQISTVPLKRAGGVADPMRHALPRNRVKPRRRDAARPAFQRTLGAGASAPPRRRETHRLRRCATVEWAAAPKAVAYDLILWRDGRRIDLWPRRRHAVLKGMGRQRTRAELRPGRYLWFVYPVYERNGRSVPGEEVHAHGAVFVTSEAVGC
jgi:hypothetical protein